MASSSKKFQLFNNQDFAKIREECVKDNKRLWEDTSYDTSTEYVWLRPKDIVENARFVKSEIDKVPTRFKLDNLKLSDKSGENKKLSLAALSALTLNPNRFRFTVPEDNVEFSASNYVGVFHFRFWRFGKFFDVVVDDRLPTRDGKLVSLLKDGHPVEFWPFILEKAYSKLCGFGESLGTMSAADFLVDLTGGISETYISQGHTKPLPVDLGAVFLNASERGSYMLFSKLWGTTSHKSSCLNNVYCITKAAYVDQSKDKEKPEREIVLRVFMPFETETQEWTGAWSDGSSEWTSVSEEHKKLLKPTHKHEFCMPFSEFSQHDWNIQVIHLSPQQMEFGAKVDEFPPWELNIFEGKWVRGVSSGGTRREFSGTTFQLNPQYNLSLTLPEDVKDCNIVISLVQKTTKIKRISVNIYVFEMRQKPEVRLDWDFFKHNNPLVDGFPHEDNRELTRRHKIMTGEYCIIAATNRPDDEANFVLRVLTDQKVTMSVFNESVAHKDVDVRASITPTFLEPEHIQESDKNVDAYFDYVSGEDKVVGWKGLKKVLDYAMENEKPRDNNYAVRNSLLSFMFRSNSVFDTMENKEFSKDLSRSLLAMADFDHSGKLTLHEFQGLWAQIRQWIKIYELHSDENGFLPKEQLREALDSAGFQLNSDILCSLAIRYSNRDNLIPFDDFLMCASKLRTVFDYYKYKDPEFTNQAVFTLEEWLQKSIYS